MKFLTAIINSWPYTFGNTETNKGIGSGSAAFGRPYYPLASGQYGPAYNVKRNLDTNSNAGLVLAQSLPSVDLRANGLYFSGDFSLLPLNSQDAGNI